VSTGLQSGTRLLVSSLGRGEREGRAAVLPLEAGSRVRQDGRQENQYELRDIHARFAKNVLRIYLAVSVVALGALTVALVSDLQFQSNAARTALSSETELRAEYIAQYLNLLSGEVQRIGARPEIDLFDQEFGPERALLDSFGGTRAIFNRGFALVDPDGALLWSTPRDLFPHGVPIAPQAFDALRSARTAQLLPSETNTGILLIATPLHRSTQFTGVLVGVIDLAAARALDTRYGRRTVEIALADRTGRVLYPSVSQQDQDLLAVTRANAGTGRPFLVTTSTEARLVVAGAPVQRTDFVLLSSVRSDALLGPVYRRLILRLSLGLALSAVPLIGFSVLLRGSLRRFRASEDEAIRAERMRSLGEAASLIAHEVRNSLNSLRLGLDVVLNADGTDRSGRRAEILKSLRGEMHRLSDFTTELLTFSRGVTPQLTPIDLSVFTGRVAEALAPRAVDRSVQLDVRLSGERLPVKADPTLVHVVLTNLVGNALDFAGGPDDHPVVVVETLRDGDACVVRVSDNGPGVADVVRPRLFEPFVTGRNNGVGIGLALSRRIARAHGGDLRLVDRGPGACFELSLPGASA